MTSLLNLRSICYVSIVVFAVTLKPLLVPYLMHFNAAPLDPSIGTIPILSEKELAKHYTNKRALIIGGTRGVGYGVALAMVKAGASVTIVGRSEKSGRLAKERLTAAAATTAGEPVVHFIRGDIGTVRNTKELITTILEEVTPNNDATTAPATNKEKYDFLVVSAATFPDWTSNLQNEDGIDKSIAIAVVGRFLIYRNMHLFLKPKNPRVLNVMASGMTPPTSLDRELISGKRNVTNLFEGMMAFSLGNEIMQILLQEKHVHNNDDDGSVRTGITCVSTHPGMLITDLHRNQGIWFDILETVLYALVGITEEECGVRQASILISDTLHKNGLSYVDDTSKGRTRSTKLQQEVQDHGDWLWEFLTNLENLK